MTMQTTTLPFQVAGANALAQPQRNAASGVQAPNAGQFGATLSREIAQRQQAPGKITGAPTPAPGPASASKPASPARQQATDKSAAQGPKATAHEPAKQSEAASDAPATAQVDAAAKAEGGDDAATAAESASAAAAAAEAAASPVTDMLAFMASLAQPVAVAAPVVAEATAAATGADVQLAALQSAFAKLDTTEGAAATGDPALATATEEAAGFSLATGVQPSAQDTLASKADLRSLQQTVQAAVQGEPKASPGGRQAVPEAAAIADTPAPAQLQAQAAKLEALAPAAVPTDRIPARVGTPAWDNQVSQRIVYMVGKEQAATLTLNPPDLGPVQVVLNVGNDGASIAFSSSELEVRQALENALPRLREMMSESGIALGNATVDAGTQQQRQAQEGERRNGNGGHAGLDHGGTGQAANDAAPRPATRTVMLGDNGMVDTFA
jgi:flagellar hook-length control protein FliK